jgi:TPR repeat protein
LKTYLRLATLAAVALTMLGCDVIEKHQLFSSRQTTETIAAADQGKVGAQYSLGVMYSNGDGVPENDAEAVKWYRRAAGQGDVDAQSILAFMYVTGEGIPKSPIDAYVWWSMAKTQGDAEAAGNLDLLKSQLTRKNIYLAQALATKCYESGYKDCD